MRRLWVQLSLAFGVVVLVTVVTIGLLADLTAGQAFRRYLSYSDSNLHQALSEALILYHQDQGGWDGIEPLLDEALSVPEPRRQWTGQRRPPGTVNWGSGPLQVVLADDSGRVIFDSHGSETGRRLTSDERAAAHDLEANGERIGQLAMAYPIQETILGPLEQSFIRRLRGVLVAGGLLAGAVGLVLGLVFSRSLTAPLLRLTAAARAVANRDFSRRVEVEGSIEMAELAQSFNEMAAGLEESEQQRQNMVADVAHELRTPLSVIQGNLQAILDDVYSLDKAEITHLYDETRLLSRLVDDLRDLAQADAGQLHLNLIPTDLAKVINSTVDNMTLVAEAQNVSLTAPSQETLPAVKADPDRLAQVLRNLLVNALRHTPSGGAITVTAGQRDSAVEIAVADTGEGIAPEDLPRVFDRFWRVNRARTRTGDDRLPGGSGLGLSVAQGLIEAHGGRIWVESVLGVGSVFHVTLPLVK